MKQYKDFKPALYEFSVGEFPYTKIYVVAEGRKQAMNKFLDAHPEHYDFKITDWWPIDIP